MLNESFVLLPGIMEKTERKFWDLGIKNWDDFLQREKISGMSKARKIFFDAKIKEAKKELQHRNAKYFSETMPASQMWRVYPEFRNEAVFLDIETGGYYGDITMVGMTDGERTMQLVKGFNLDKEILKKVLENYSLIVTFNGSSFDLPVIDRYFRKIVPEVPHIDLRHACARIGLSGGLKSIERQIGIKRNANIDAVLLWQKWQRTGNRKHLDRLMQYNEEDAANLKPLMEFCYEELKKKIMGLNPQIKV